jgi:hypothetical protein
MKKTVFVMALLLAIGGGTVKAQNTDAAQTAFDEIEADNHVKDDDATRTADSPPKAEEPPEPPTESAMIERDNDTGLTADSDDDNTLTADASTNGRARPALTERPSFIWRSKGTGITYSFVYSGDKTYGNVWMMGYGVAHSRFITKNLSCAIDANYWFEGGGVSGVNIPALCQLDRGVLSLEGGVQFDLLFDGYTSVFNLGFVSGAGLSFGKYRLFKFFYRYNCGTAYGSHTFGMRKLF